MQIPRAGSATEPRTLRVLIVDDHEVILAGLRSMLTSDHLAVSVVGTTTDSHKAIHLTGELEPDLVLLDVRLKGTSGIDLCLELKDRFPNTRVVFFTDHDSERYLFQGLRAGASGFLLKRTTGAQLAQHLAMVMAGVVVVDPAIAGRTVTTAARMQAGAFWPGVNLCLTRRESEVLGLMVQGLSNRAISQALFVGEATVKSHVKSMYLKLHVGGRSQAVAMALREGLFF